jgi:prepilin signal peptidase PulO-like enzyme (type II secretory pathway)
MPDPSVLAYVIVALVGLLAGAIINALADDLPHHRRPRMPRYPDGTPRTSLALSGLLAFLAGRRRSPGGTRLSWRHPLTELATAALFVVTLAVVADDLSMPLAQFIIYLLYMAIFVLVTVIDLEHRLILFVVIIPSALLALFDATFIGYGIDLSTALLGGALGFGLFFLLYLGGFAFTAVLSQVRGEKIDEVAFGYGDVMLITLSGLILGWQVLIIAMFITVFLGAAGAILYLIVRRLAGRHYTLFTPLPYGQYIVIATLLLLLFTPEIRGLLLAAY